MPPARPGQGLAGMTIDELRALIAEMLRKDRDR